MLHNFLQSVKLDLHITALKPFRYLEAVKCSLIALPCSAKQNTTPLKILTPAALHPERMMVAGPRWDLDTSIVTKTLNPGGDCSPLGKGEDKMMT